jgi:O-methyltransferase
VLVASIAAMQPAHYPLREPPKKPLLRGRAGARRALNHALARVGLVVIPKPPEERLEHDFLAIYEQCAYATMTSRERMYCLWQAVDHITAAGIPGDVVECGVWRGGSTMLAAMTLQRRGDTTRRLWLYDTFAGMVEPGQHDRGRRGEDAHQMWAEMRTGDHNEWCYSPLDEVQANMRRTGLAPERFKFVMGKVEDTIPGELPKRIALLRLDTDWYESTRHELIHLFPLLEPGGVLIVDDYGDWEGARRAVDEYFDETGTKILLSRIDETGRIGVKT